MDNHSSDTRPAPDADYNYGETGDEISGKPAINAQDFDPPDSGFSFADLDAEPETEPDDSPSDDLDDLQDDVQSGPQAEQLGVDVAAAETAPALISDADIPWRGMSLLPASEPPVVGVLHGAAGEPLWGNAQDNCYDLGDPLGSFDAAFGQYATEEVDPTQTELVLGVKLSQYGPVYFFKAGQERLGPGSQVLVDAEQGVSLAEVFIARRLRLPLPKIRTEEGQEVEIRPIRGLAGPADIAAAADNKIMASSARMFCRECIRERNLDMKLVDVEVLHDRSKIIFYFTAPTRIDFRELVKDLVRNYHTRIELRQIGVRHETQMIGALGNCGMTCCCRRYLRKFAPVTIKMAKEQNLFLNPAKLSGICGRLLCCLSYEQENYEEFHKRSPKIGKKYRTSKGVVKVMRANLFRQSLFIQDEAGEEAELQLEEWEALLPVRLEAGAPENERATERTLERVQERIPERERGSERNTERAEHTDHRPAQQPDRMSAERMPERPQVNQPDSLPPAGREKPAPKHELDQLIEQLSEQSDKFVGRPDKATTANARAERTNSESPVELVVESPVTSKAEPEDSVLDADLASEMNAEAQLDESEDEIEIVLEADEAETAADTDTAAAADKSIFGLPGSKYAGQRGKPGHNRNRNKHKHNKNKR